jgi:hypothetical protein
MIVSPSQLGNYKIADTQPGMSMSRGISKGFRIVAPFRSFPSPVAAMAGAAAPWAFP